MLRLSQVVGYVVQTTFGNEGLVFGHALLVTLTAAVVMLAVHRRGIDGRFAVAAGVAMLILDLPIAGTIRPQLFGQLGAALVLLACSELPSKRHPLLWLPIVGMRGPICSSIPTLRHSRQLPSIAIGVLRKSFRSPRRHDPRMITMAAAVLLLVLGVSIRTAALSRDLLFGSTRPGVHQRVVGNEPSQLDRRAVDRLADRRRRLGKYGGRT
jgi:hypothetical protein